jgi:hypothetical protein
MKRILVIAGIALATMMLDAPALAANEDGVCNASSTAVGEFCLAYHSMEYPTGKGSIWDLSFVSGPEYNYNQPVQRVFQTPNQDGFGQSINDNAASARNAYVGATVNLFSEVHYLGTVERVYTGPWHTLPSNIKNLGSSHNWTE